MNRLASIIFSRTLVFRGLSSENMEDLFAELPRDCKIVSFGEDLCRSVFQITISHDKFKEVEVGSHIPEIIATFTKDKDGVEDCKLDFSQVLEDGYKVEYTDWLTEIDTYTREYFAPKMISDEKPRQSYPINYIPSQLDLNSDWYDDFGDFDFDIEEELEKPKDLPKEKKFCQHKWKKVQGVNRYYVICEHCEERNKEMEEDQWK